MSDKNYAVKTARKQHLCSQGMHVIRCGDRYLYAACPPWHEMNRSRKGEQRWEVSYVCLRCAEEWGWHTSETRKQIQEERP